MEKSADLSPKSSKDNLEPTTNDNTTIHIISDSHKLTENTNTYVSEFWGI
jgi:hypothetical protein